MSRDDLRSAVEQFASVTVQIDDAGLERAWEWQSYDEGIRFAFFRTYEELRELAARLAAQRCRQGPPPSTAQHALGQYHAAYLDLQAVLLGLNNEQLALQPAPGEWSVIQILPHIIEATGGFFANIVFALERGRSNQGTPPVRMTKEDRVKFWAGDPFYQVLDSTDAGEIISYHDSFHQRILRELAGIQEQELAIPSWWWEDEPYTLEFRLHRFDSHLRQHTVQAEKTLAMLGFAPNEAKRLLRWIYNALAEVENTQIGAWDFGADQRQQAAAQIAARAEEIAQLIHA
jgi:hypothetical protein